MDTIAIYTPNLSPPKPALRQVIREATDQMTTHTRTPRAKRPLPTRSTDTTGNCPVQKRHLTHNPPQHEQINNPKAAYTAVSTSQKLCPIELPSIYFAHQREVFERDGILLAVSEYAQPVNGESAAVEWVRYRTVGDLTITGAVRSQATDIERVIAEISAATVSERGETRADDRTSAAAMEDRKREGYF